MHAFKQTMASSLRLSHSGASLLRLRRRAPVNAPRCSSSSTRCTARAFHASTTRDDMVAPPDPISHMRPVIYDNPVLPVPASNVRHPYSLTEFKADEGSEAAGSGDLELQFRIMRQQLDTLHQNFWLDHNTRFYAARAAVLESLPEDASVRDKEEALSAFFRQWVMQEKEDTDAYTTEWRRRNFRLISLSARVAFQKVKTRFSFRPKSSS